MTPAPRRQATNSPAITKAKLSQGKRQSSVVPGLPSLTVTRVQKRIDLKLTPTKEPEIRATTAPTKFRVVRQSSVTKRPTEQTIERPPSVKKAPVRRLPRTDTTLAIKAFHHLFCEEEPSPTDDKTNSEPKEELKNVSDEDDDEHLFKVAAMAKGSPTPEECWNIKDIQNNFGWVVFYVSDCLNEQQGGKQRFMSRVRKTKSRDEPKQQMTEKSPQKVDSEDADLVNNDNMTCAEAYINTCIQWHLTPEPFIIPKREACTIDLSYYGAGNRPIEALSTCLSSIPKLQALVIRENRLNDAAVAQVLQSSDFSRLLTLNLSCNEIKKEASQALCHFLDMNRVVQTLILSDCLLHSDFLRELGPVVARNQSLTSLDMSKNKFDDNCAEAIGAMCNDNNHLLCLDLSWNSLRGKSGKCIGTALEINQTLQTLCLAWNGIGSANGATYLALALRHNTTLQTLELMGNSIGPEGALALTHAWSDSSTLEILGLAQNPISTEGLRGIFRAYSSPLTIVQGRMIHFEDCGMHSTAPIFTPTLHGHVEIDLENGTTFWHAFEYLRLLNLYPTACSWREVFHSTNSQYKVKLNFQRVIKQSAISESNTISISQLMALEESDTPWRIPLYGKLNFEFNHKPAVPHVNEIVPDAVSVFWQAFSGLEFDSERVKYMKLFLQDHYITAAQAQYLLNTVTALDPHSDVLPILMERVTDTESLFSREANTTRHMTILKERAGKLFFFDVKMPNGHYKLDLSISLDHRIAMQLLRLSADDKLQNKENGGVNTSQRGNWECFRNETLDGKPYTISRATGFPECGIFVCDFVTTTRIPIGSEAIATEELENLCKKITSVGLPTESILPSKPTRRFSRRASQTISSVSTPFKNQTTLTQQRYEHRKLAIRETFSGAAFGITCAQVLSIAENFSDVEFGRVEVIAMLLNVILDLDILLTTILEKWSPRDVNEAIHRIGWLNLWNPMYAEMEYTLRLDVWEEYQVTSILAQLGDIEPGENWIDESYNDIFGWQLPLSWVQGRIPHTGHLYLKYTTGPNNKNRVNAAREDLKKKTLSGKICKAFPATSNKTMTNTTSAFKPPTIPTPRRHRSLLSSAL